MGGEEYEKEWTEVVVQINKKLKGTSKKAWDKINKSTLDFFAK